MGHFCGVSLPIVVLMSRPSAAHGNDLETPVVPEVVDVPLVDPGRQAPACPPTQPISGAARFRQGQPDRAERSEPRSGALDGFAPAELAVANHDRWRERGPPWCGAGVAWRSSAA